MGKYDDLIKRAESRKEQANGYDYDKLFHDRVEVWSSIIIAEIAYNVERDIDFNIAEATNSSITNSDTIAKEVWRWKWKTSNYKLLSDSTDSQYHLKVLDYEEETID